MPNEIIKKVLEQELENKNLIYPFISGLDGKEIKILELRRQGQTLQEIGNKLELTRERVRQIEEKALSKITFQKKIIEVLAEAIGKVVFVEQEIEQSYIEMLGDVIDYTNKKIKYQELAKILWANKNKNANSSN